ncbi:MAG: ribonuclease Y [Kiritimatiellae bacterium]|jgi:ribonuclease Y|nr:ribonuclease Y [Kiritimatiellia bacterium]
MTSLDWYDFSDATVGLLFGMAGVLGGYALRGLVGRWQADAIEKKAQLVLEDADVEVKNKLKEADIMARAEVVKAREEFEKSTKVRRGELQDVADRLTVREEKLDTRAVSLDEKEQGLAINTEKYRHDAEILHHDQKSVLKKKLEADDNLQNLAGMTHEQARKELYSKAENEVRGESGNLVRRVQEEAKESADREAARIVALAVQRYSTAHASEIMTSSVALESDDIKGRIIGREGRNIRALESLTGVSILVDDTPEMVVISGFDPVRREIARQSLELLVADGRIHPQRIEDVIKSVTEDMDKRIYEAGEAAAFEACVQGVPVEVLRCMGRLRFRTSYTQNVLQHCIEVAHLMGLMAAELGCDPLVARRIGFFHDIGKAMDHTVEGPHAIIGAEFLKKSGEIEEVVNGVASHHNEVPANGMLAVLCSAADAISSSRPGARAENLGNYVKRLEDLESIANAFDGVKNCFAVQAGREIRVIVDPAEISDNESVMMAREISSQISSVMKFPGQIRVVVVRETRCVDYAR